MSLALAAACSSQTANNSNALSADPTIAARARAAIELPASLPETHSPLVTIGGGQLDALALTRTRGTDPAKPRGLSQDTETR